MVNEFNVFQYYFGPECYAASWFWRKFWNISDFDEAHLLSSATIKTYKHVYKAGEQYVNIAIDPVYVSIVHG